MVDIVLGSVMLLLGLGYVGRLVVSRSRGVPVARPVLEMCVGLTASGVGVVMLLEGVTGASYSAAYYPLLIGFFVCAIWDLAASARARSGTSGA